MQVNVFVTRAEGKVQHDLLVLPLSPHSAIPPQYRNGWNYYATVDTGDRMFGDIDARAIERELASSGFAVVTPQAPDRR
ncbi:MAG TPA: hypothetical protein VGN60_02185 [Devosia sp.]|nr:hypothetical protein [Devosia sp.]